MSMRRSLAAAAAVVILASGSATAQGPAEWRAVAPDNLLVLDTSKGRVLIEMAPDVAPAHVERIRTLTAQGFYDGLPFHRVIDGFMAQTGDPLGTGAGGSELPNVPGEFHYRRGPQPAFGAVSGSDGSIGASATLGLHGALPVATQPNGQMFMTADGRVDATAWFCPGVAGMARTDEPDTANSQFFLMTGVNPRLNGSYSVWGRVVDGLDVVEALKSGPMEADGAVRDNPDRIVTARVAAELDPAQRPAVEVLDAGGPAFRALVEESRAARGAGFSICDIQLPARVTGGA